MNRHRADVLREILAIEEDILSRFERAGSAESVVDVARQRIAVKRVELELIEAEKTNG